MENYLRIYKLRDKIQLFKEITIDDIKYVSKKWKQIYIQFLIDYGFNKNSALMLFEWGDGGHNWLKLHSTSTEDADTLYQRLEHFENEIHYCADRMSLDRLFRCHWQYNHMMIKFYEDTEVTKYNKRIKKDNVIW